MENKGLVFIPDISGFTRFVSESEIDHSRVIIQDLLETLINANTIGLEVSEIEGDAILFYRFGDVPDLEELYGQVEQMFSQFHHYLAGYDLHRYCQCRACISASSLTLKIITHYGEFTQYNVKSFNKLIGKDIIVAHQLLKNDIDQHEYWLLTQNLTQQQAPGRFAKWMQWHQSVKELESGEIAFHYTQLGRLKQELPPVSPPSLEIADKVKMISVSREYDTFIIKLCHAAGDFNNRHRWQEGVQQVEAVSHYLPRIGMKTRRITDKGEEVVYATTYSFSQQRIEFSETDEEKTHAMNFLIEETGPGRMRLTMDYYIRRNPVKELLFRLFTKKKIQASMEQSLRNLDKLLGEMDMPEPDLSHLGW